MFRFSRILGQGKLGKGIYDPAKDPMLKLSPTERQAIKDKLHVNYNKTYIWTFGIVSATAGTVGLILYLEGKPSR